MERRNGWTPSPVGSDKIRHLKMLRGRFYFEPSPAMRRAGFRSEALGTDEAAAQARLLRWNAEWDLIRRGLEPVKSEDLAPAGTLNRFVQDLRSSAEYRDKSKSRQDEIEYSLKTILPIFGPTKLTAIKPEQVDVFYATLRSQGSEHKAARIMKDLRYLLNRAHRFGLIRFNPALAVKVKQPAPRTQTWQFEQVEHTISTAIDNGMLGLAAMIGLIYDSGLSPIDARKLRLSDIVGDGDAVGRSKSGRTQYVTVSDETLALIRAYHENLGVTLMPSSYVIRTKRGRQYTKDHLTRDFRKLAKLAGLPYALKLSDLRRTAAHEAADGGATVSELAAKFGWSHRTAAKMLDTYNPASAAQAKHADEKRRANKK